ncbi:MAG: peptidylprolyl isomerase [Planctomycetes bacterium]|nr:peptidylprolyl isomerase [Planctomycetota bacterium]
MRDERRKEAGSSSFILSFFIPHPSSLIPEREATVASNVKSQVEAAQKDLDLNTKVYTAELTTSKGPIRLQFFPEVAPGHVKNFLALAKVGFYNGGTFHRVIKGFMIQGGCPEGTGRGGPGYQIQAEFNATPHEPGVLSMARTNDPNSAGSQFFICLDRQPHLDRQYTAFGKTADDESLATVRAIGAVPTRGDKPVQPVVIEKVTLSEGPK